jgi:hypothetical protein
MQMRVTLSSVLVVILIATGPAARLKAEGGDAEAAFRTSIETAAKALASSQSEADAAANADWSRLANLTGGRRIVIRTRDGQVVHATLIDADAVSLTAMAEALRRSFARADIAEVRSGSTPSRAGGYAGFAVGVLVGFEMGAGIALGCAGHCSGGQKTGEWLSIVGLPVGLSSGGYWGLRRPGEVIYRAP